MVFKQKVGSATKNKNKKAVQSPKPSTFELDAHDDDNDSDKEMDSDDVQEPPKTSNKKTPQRKTPSKQTPAKQTPGKQTPAKQTPGKQTPAKQTPGKKNLAKQTPGKTPNKNNSLVPDKKVSFELASATPTATDSQVGKRQATPASKSKQGVQEFKGLKAGLKNKSQTSLKMDEEGSTDDKEEDEDDDSKQNVLKNKLKQKIGYNQDEEESDDGKEDDDEEEDDDDQEEDDDDQEDDDKEDDSLTKQNEKNLAIEQRNKEVEDLRDARQLMVRNLPSDITREEVKSLSDDIIHVTLPGPLFVKRDHCKTMFCFVQFASEEKAEQNYAAFQNQKLRGVPIEYDYSGVKSKTPKTNDIAHIAVYDAKRLRISGLPTDIKVMQIAELTPSSTSIFVNAPTAPRAAYVDFDSEEAAAEAFENNKEAKINGIPVTVLYALKRNIKKNLAIEQKNQEIKHKRDSKQLLIKKLPVDITCEELKSLSDDIIHVILVNPDVPKKWSTTFAFVVFASEKKAKENFASFESKKLRGVPIEYDYVGVKTKKQKQTDFAHNIIYDAKMLYISNLAPDVKVMQIAELTPSAISIVTKVSTIKRLALVTFDSEEAAAEAFEANKEAKINGKPVCFLYAMSIKKSYQKQILRKRKYMDKPFQHGGQPPFAKRPRQDLDATLKTK